jgi:wyosine [tRNA(Phe)-imidazoG37] synthetase (radical SAM superfamily)
VSIGLNLNPDKICNFDCVYCQVERQGRLVPQDVDPTRLLDELEGMIDLVQSGELFHSERFANVPNELRRLNDIAFSGDGEPTTPPEFPEIARSVAELKRRRQLAGVKLVLITNATLFHRPAVALALKILDANEGEIWAKLDAGTEDYYHLIERTTIPFQQILSNLTRAAQARPIVIQSMFLKLAGVGPSLAERDAYCARLNEIVRSGGNIKLVQIYTIVRKPAEKHVTPLSNEEVDDLAAQVKGRTGLEVASYHGAS